MSRSMSFVFYADFDWLFFPLAVDKSTPSGPATRDQSHIDETLRLATAEASQEFVGES